MNASLSNTSHISGNMSSDDVIVFGKTEDIVIKVFYIMISLVDITFNTVVIYIIAKSKRLQNAVNLLVVNLLSADIVAGFAVYPYLFIEVTEKDLKENRGDLKCGFKNGLTMFLGATNANFMTLAALSLSRYLLINHPTKQRWRIHKSYVKWICIATWFIGVTLLLPNIVSYRYIPESGTCRRHWPRWLDGTTLFAASCTIYFSAFFSLLFTFGSTVRTLWFKASIRRMARNNTGSSVQASRKKATFLLGLLILAFLICWLPFATYWFLSAVTEYFKNTVEDSVKKVRVLRYSLLVAFTNTCLDPVIYAFGNSEIKATALEMLGRRKTHSIELTSTANEKRRHSEENQSSENVN